VAGIVAVGLFFGRGPSAPGFDEGFYDDYLEDFGGTATVQTVDDPWLSRSGSSEPSPGRRFVAYEVTVENDGSDDFPVYVASSSFKLTDGDGFVYQPVYNGIEPGLPEGIQLEVGEKARGWIVFDIGEDADIASLSHFNSELELPITPER
jgi:hypothetical protein